MFAATFFDGDAWHEGVVEVDDEGGMLLRDAAVPADLPRLDGVVLGGFTDHHVHLQLVEAALLHDSMLGRVVDLGGNPSVLRDLSGRATAIEFAGAFLTPSGGYPSDRDWAPTGSFREIATAGDAATVVAEMADAGAACIKVASNSDAGPVFDDELLRAIIELAARRDLPVVVHAQGPGEAQRAARFGVSTLAHAPFTERLTDDEIAEQAASVSWISTLAIHDGVEYETAVDNVRRFRAAGGTVRYGTDMGNGPTPVDLNPREIAALRDTGIDGIDLLRALAPLDPRDPASFLVFLPRGDAVTCADPLRARRLTPADLKV